MRPLLVVCLLAGIATAAPVPKGVKKKDDKELIVGTWKPTNKDSAWFQFAADGTLKTWHGETETPNSQMNWTWALDP